MKTITLTITAMLLCILSSFAQKDTTTAKEFHTLLGNKKASHGAYLGLSVGITQINNTDALTSGARLMWVINHGIGIGFGGNGFTNQLDWDAPYYTGISGGYGGLVFEPIVAPRMPVHIAFPVLLGVGGVAKTPQVWNDIDWYPEDSDVFLIAEPGAEIELNLVKFVRLCFGASYRFARNVDLSGYPNDVLNNFSGNITLKIGKF